MQPNLSSTSPLATFGNHSTWQFSLGGGVRILYHPRVPQKPPFPTFQTTNPDSTHFIISLHGIFPDLTWWLVHKRHRLLGQPNTYSCRRFEDAPNRVPTASKFRISYSVVENINLNWLRHLHGCQFGRAYLSWKILSQINLYQYRPNARPYFWLDTLILRHGFLTKISWLCHRSLPNKEFGRYCKTNK